ncbi:hypothetical protein CIP101434_02466 [Corynebacterium diphtheriae]|nr:hypothetical protein CIP102550_02239 [Corynebacterium diphtheriae]CAB0530957.1 hypothetical protein CIP101280_02467 [Corynebacterium diphtheriae]CAB0530971.1 hypothetical protein CIP101434_02466 [Corynebacterium diphtheriae]CAB0922563.1 hypothetical protein FRC0430_02445 [Corynebacterium diphtheriae]CAB0922774.1 hypothetical protein FRC0431_00791 [Corynebacterium diphtheriae]
MTTVSPKKGHDSGKVNEISEKLMGTPELARGCRILCVRGNSPSYFKQGQVLLKGSPAIKAKAFT